LDAGETETNKKRFEYFFKNKDDIETKFGKKTPDEPPLEWERLDDKRASRIVIRFYGTGLKDKEKWDELQDKMIDAMNRLHNTLKEYIRKLD